MANQDFNITGLVTIRPAEEKDAEHLHTSCFPEKTNAAVTKELKADLAEDSLTSRLVAEASGYAIGQIAIGKNAADAEAAQISGLAVSGPFRQLGVADHLMEAAEKAAAESGAKTLEIELAASETSVIQRYKSWGFVEKPLVILQKPLDGEAETEEADDSEPKQNVEASGGEQQELLGT